MLYMIEVGSRHGSHIVKRHLFVESDDPVVAYAVAKPMCGPEFRPVVEEYVPPVPDLVISKARFLAERGSVAYGTAKNETKYTPALRYCPSQRGEL